MPPGTAQLLSARASQGQCSISSIATCDLGSLAPGIGGVRDRHVRPAGERDFVSTAIASAKADDGSNAKHRRMTTTRGVKHAPRSRCAGRRPTRRSGSDATTRCNGRLRGVAGGVSVDLSRDDGATWTRLSDEAENVGFYDWTGAGGSPLARESASAASAARADADVTELCDRHSIDPRRGFKLLPVRPSRCVRQLSGCRCASCRRSSQR